jgi:hypothetical protein
VNANQRGIPRHWNVRFFGKRFVQSVKTVIAYTLEFERTLCAVFGGNLGFTKVALDVDG